jgi:hypothetical protein
MNRSRDLRGRTKRIIWNDYVWKGQGQGSIIKEKRWNRSAMALRAVQNTIITFELSCSCASSLRGIWGSFWPACNINTINRNIFKRVTYMIHKNFSKGKVADLF